jgi:hypothetical protein
MNPTFLVLGLVLGALLFRHLTWGAVAIVVASIMGAVALTIAEDLSVSEGLGSFLLCAANLGVGFVLAVIVARRIRPKVERMAAPDR